MLLPDLSICNLQQSLLPYPSIKGKIDVLAITSLKRMSVLQDIPTVAESGIPGYQWTTWFAMFAPAGIPGEIRDTLNSAMRKALQVPEVREGLVKQGIEPEASSPEELADYLKKSIAVFRAAIEKANLKPSSD